MKDLPLRPNVCMLVFNNQGKFLLGEREGEAGIWQFPQGGVEPQFSLEENVLKELHEELGADPICFQIESRLSATHEYNFDKPPKHAVGKWRGQSQTFWLVRFLGADTDIRLDRFEAEFSDWRWCSRKEIQELAEPKRWPGYVKPIEEAQEILRAKYHFKAS